MPLDTVLCLDTSGSMSNRGILELKAATGSFLDGVEETAQQAGLKVKLHYDTYTLGCKNSSVKPITIKSAETQEQIQTNAG